jgi:hypothetical protein
MTKVLRLSAVTATGALLAACGGNSDGGPLPVDYAVITGENAPDVAAAVLGASLEGAPLGEYAQLLALSGSLSTPPPNGSSSSAGGALAKAAVLLGKGATGPSTSPITPTTSPCSVGGTVTLSGDISSTQTLTPGDTISFEFAQCDDGVTVVSGMFELTIAAFAGDLVSGSVSLEVGTTLVDFHVTENGVTSASLDGDVTLGLDLTASPSIGITASSSGLDVSNGTAVYTLENYAFSETSDSVTGAYTRTVSGRAWSSAFSGAVDFETSLTLESFDAGFAYTGRIEVSGERGATITIVVLDSTAIRLEVDEDGDGIVDQSIDTTWDALA